MTTPSFDAAQYKAGQRQEWNAVADAWERWWETIERGSQPVSDRLVEMVGLGLGHRVVDVATGIGEPAVTAARMVGPSGRVVATDQSPQMLAIARGRGEALGLQNMEFQEMDAEGLDLPDSAFDAVLCRYGLMFLPDLGLALRNMLRLLVPGGRIAAAVWGIPPKTPLLSTAMGVLREMFNLPPPPPGTPGPNSLADTAALEQAVREAGFVDVRSESMTMVVDFPSVDTYTSFLGEIAPPIRALLANQPPERQTQAWDAIAQAARQYATADGSVVMSNETICVTGQRPL